jgi:hypothetical protein
MDSEEKKPQIDEEAMLMEIEEAEQQEIDEDDLVEQEMRESEEEEMNPSGEDDDIDRLEWEHEMREMAKVDIIQSMWASDESSDEMRKKMKTRKENLWVEKHKKVISG